MSRNGPNFYTDLDSQALIAPEASPSIKSRIVNMKRISNGIDAIT